MRVWDIHPGYLNRQSLLGEHRELHGIVSIIVNNKKGYANHPETKRWLGYGWALRQRHQLLAAEMALRGYTDKSPVRTRSRQGEWPAVYIDEPAAQFDLLKEKYREKEPGRIPLPKNAQQLWSHHKYSVLARDQRLYRKIGRDIATGQPGSDFNRLAKILTEQLRTPPPAGSLQNALQHMWGHVSDDPLPMSTSVTSWSLPTLLAAIQQRVTIRKEPYLSSSTALSELEAWL